MGPAYSLESDDAVFAVSSSAAKLSPWEDLNPSEPERHFLFNVAWLINSDFDSVKINCPDTYLNLTLFEFLPQSNS